MLTLQTQPNKSLKTTNQPAKTQPAFQGPSMGASAVASQSISHKQKNSQLSTHFSNPGPVHCNARELIIAKIAKAKQQNSKIKSNAKEGKCS